MDRNNLCSIAFSLLLEGFQKCDFPVYRIPKLVFVISTVYPSVPLQGMDIYPHRLIQFLIMKVSQYQEAGSKMGPVLLNVLCVVLILCCFMQSIKWPLNGLKE